MLVVQSPYIHYHFENNWNKIPTMFSPEEAKQKVLNTFLQRFQNSVNFNKANLNKKNITKQQALTFLKQISHNGSIGGILEQELSSQHFIDNAMGENINLVTTGAGINVPNKILAAKIPEEAVRILDIVNTKINMIISVFSKYGEKLLISQLINLQNGQPIPKELSYLNNQGFSRQLLSLYDIASEELIQSLQDNIQDIAAIGIGQKTSTKVDFISLVTNIRGAFNNIGGFLNEEAISFFFNSVSVTGAKDISEKINSVIKSTPHAKLIELNKSEFVNDRISGKDVKNDITVDFTKDKVVFHLGGSIKNSQSTKSLKGNVTIKNVHSGFSLGDLITESYTLAGKDISEVGGYEAAIGAVFNSPLAGSSNNNSYITMWNSLKEYGKYAAALRMLTGSGDFNANDFSSLFIVNDKIYSMYQILENLTKNFDLYTGSMRKALDDANIKDLYSKNRKAVRAKAAKGPQMKEWRSETTKRYIQDFYNKKIQMDLNLTKMLSAGVL